MKQELGAKVDARYCHEDDSYEIKWQDNPDRVPQVLNVSRGNEEFLITVLRHMREHNHLGHAHHITIQDEYDVED